MKVESVCCLRRQVLSLSAHGRITGLVLFCLAPALVGILMLIAPAHMKVMFTDPIGIRITIVMVTLQMIGFYAMRRIVDIEI